MGAQADGCEPPRGLDILSISPPPPWCQHHGTIIIRFLSANLSGSRANAPYSPRLLTYSVYASTKSLSFSRNARWKITSSTITLLGSKSATVFLLHHDFPNPIKRDQMTTHRAYIQELKHHAELRIILAYRVPRAIAHGTSEALLHYTTLNLCCSLTLVNSLTIAATSAAFVLGTSSSLTFSRAFAYATLDLVVTIC